VKIKKIKKLKTLISRFPVFGFTVFTLFFAATVSFAQPKPNPTPAPKPKPIVVEIPDIETIVKSTINIVLNEGDNAAEKSIQTDPKVNITLCVDEGKITINGWNRDEIRVFATNGTQVGFKVMQKLKDKPAWVNILGFNPQKTKTSAANECLSGDEIELDVPLNAVVNLKARESETTISSVGKVRIENASGDTTLRKIANGIEVKTFEGNIFVENSSGAITLSTTSGNVLALDVSANEIGDIFKAKTTSGAVNLKDIGYTQIEANSNSGSIRYNGEFSEGGQYSFGTMKGSMTLLIPKDSSCKVNATYSFGSFSSEIAYKAEQKSSGNEVKKLAAIFGKGDATVNITTYNGKILIKNR
jgi:Putative adhesin